MSKIKWLDAQTHERLHFLQDFFLNPWMKTICLQIDVIFSITGKENSQRSCLRSRQHKNNKRQSWKYSFIFTKATIMTYILQPKIKPLVYFPFHYWESTQMWECSSMSVILCSAARKWVCLLFLWPPDCKTPKQLGLQPMYLSEPYALRWIGSIKEKKDQ